MRRQILYSKILGFHGGDYEEWCLPSPPPQPSEFSILNPILTSSLIWYFFATCVGC
jgi:hypothetical protein